MDRGEIVGAFHLKRALVRDRRKLSQLRAGLKAQIHAVLGKEGLLQPVNHLWGPGGAQWLDETDMAVPYDTRVRSLRRLIKPYDAEITKLDTYIAQMFKGHAGYERNPSHPRVGPVLGAIFVAELVDVTLRQDSQTCVLVGRVDTPPPRTSDSKVQRGSITKQGPPLLLWAAIEAGVEEPWRRRHQTALPAWAERRGKNKGRVAAARKVLTLVYYGLRDGEIPSVAPPEAA